MIPFDKRTLRRELKHRRDALADRAGRSVAICNRVTTLPAYRLAKSLHCYMPIRSEVDTFPLLHDALACAKGVVVPIVRADMTELVHSRIVSLAAEDLEPGAFGTIQPRALQLVNINTCDLIIVPLLAFDRSRYRLGYGKGFYDRLLATSPAATIGVAFAAQEVDRLPREPHDLPLDWIVTEDEVVTIRQEIA